MRTPLRTNFLVCLSPAAHPQQNVTFRNAVKLNLKYTIIFPSERNWNIYFQTHTLGDEPEITLGVSVYYRKSPESNSLPSIFLEQYPPLGPFLLTPKHTNEDRYGNKTLILHCSIEPIAMFHHCVTVQCFQGAWSSRNLLVKIK